MSKNLTPQRLADIIDSMFRKIKNYIMNLFSRNTVDTEMDYVNYHDSYVNSLTNNNNKQSGDNKWEFGINS